MLPGLFHGTAILAPFPPMQTYDFVMIFVLGGLTLYGYAKGMAWQIAYLTSFFASYFVARMFSGQLAPLFGDAAPWNKFAAWAAIYAGCSLVTWMIFRVIKNGINKVKLQSFDRQMGAFVGAARGALWCLGITFFAVTLLPDTVKQQIIASQSGRYIAKFLDQADSIVPPEIHQVIGPHLDRLENELNQQPPAPGGVPAQQPFGNQWGSGQFGAAQQNTGATPNTGAAWPQASTPAPTQPVGSGWPTATSNNAWPATGNAWPTSPQPSGTPAQPASWPNQPQPANPWPRQ